MHTKRTLYVVETSHAELQKKWETQIPKRLFGDQKIYIQSNKIGQVKWDKASVYKASELEGRKHEIVEPFREGQWIVNCTDRAVEEHPSFHVIEDDNGNLIALVKFDVEETVEEAEQTSLNLRKIHRAPEMFEALKGLRGIEPWIGDPETKRHFQKTVYPIIQKIEGNG